jgi:hypothetical protein
LASVLLKSSPARLSASPSCVVNEEAAKEMRKLLEILITVIIAMTLSVASLAQKGGDDKRPPKENPKVVERPKPPPNSNRGNQSNSNKRGRP